ncbi:helix-turn-helix domain-containing protein [Streptomyces sp. NPDC056400]|uniref:helix-turn-helix domain-containing protein n=1 Tax=Streptomyces sp. NPDC056400 TaxID=3345808 RepID=UPI0035E08CEB
MQLPLHELPRTPIVDRTRYRYANVQELVAAGWTISAIARRLNRDRKTVRRFRDTDLDRLLASAHERQPASQPARVLDPFKPYLNTQFTESLGQVSGSRLFLEICELGYRGSRQVVRKHLAALRAGHAEPDRADIPSPARSPAGSCDRRTLSHPDSNEACSTSASPARTSTGPATSPEPSPSSSAPGAASC